MAVIRYADSAKSSYHTSVLFAVIVQAFVHLKPPASSSTKNVCLFFIS